MVTFLEVIEFLVSIVGALNNSIINLNERRFNEFIFSLNRCSRWCIMEIASI